MNNKNILFSCLLFVFLSSCVNARDKPNWIESEAERYPNNLYITSTGSASDAELAKDRALANLSKVFEVHIDEMSTTKSDTHVSLHNMKETIAKKNRLSQLIRVSTDKVIQGSQIVESWKDDELAIFYALVVLDRKQAKNNIMDEINRLDEEASSRLENIKLQDDVLLTIAGLNKIISLQQNRLSLHNMLKVINLHGRGYPSEWQLFDFQRQLEAELKLLKISGLVDVSNNSMSNQLSKILKSSMANSGFPASDESDYILKLSLHVNELGFQQGWYWERAKLTVELVKSSGQIIEQKEWSLKVSALQKEDAQSRLLTLIANTLNADLRPLIIGAASTNF